MADVQSVLKTDLHLHTSEDPADVILHDSYALIDRAVELGFDAVAITLHDRQLTDGRVFAYARERGICVLPGVESWIARLS
jgi:predicted metal-dependent phosphoesterase TrpH